MNCMLSEMLNSVRSLDEAESSLNYCKRRDIIRS